MLEQAFRSEGISCKMGRSTLMENLSNSVFFPLCMFVCISWIPTHSYTYGETLEIASFGDKHWETLGTLEIALWPKTWGNTGNSIFW